MNKLPFILLAVFFSCQSIDPNASVMQTEATQEPLRHNQELEMLYTVLQNDTGENVEIARRVYQLLDSNRVRTALDYSRASIILHQIKDKKAVTLMKKSVAMDPVYSRTLFSAAIEKHLNKE